MQGAGGNSLGSSGQNLRKDYFLHIQLLCSRPLCSFDANGKAKTSLEIEIGKLK